MMSINFVANLTSAFAVALAAMTAAIAPASAEKLHVQLDQLNHKGMPWDGLNVRTLMGSTNFGDAPDIKVCLIYKTGGPLCLMRFEDRGRHRNAIERSVCENSHDCEFDLGQVDAKVFGVLIVEIDRIGYPDLVDAVVIRRQSNGPVDAAFWDQRLRDFSFQLAPTRFASERARRERPFPVIDLAECTDEIGCRLRQSRITLRD